MHYIRGRASRGRRRAVCPCYEPEFWLQYQELYDRTARTKNISEPRFQGMMSKRHPSVFAFLVKLQKEQSDTTTVLEHLDLGPRMKPPLSSKRKQASRYDEFKRMKMFLPTFAI